MEIFTHDPGTIHPGRIGAVVHDRGGRGQRAAITVPRGCIYAEARIVGGHRIRNWYVLARSVRVVHIRTVGNDAILRFEPRRVGIEVIVWHGRRGETFVLKVRVPPMVVLRSTFNYVNYGRGDGTRRVYGTGALQEHIAAANRILFPATGLVIPSTWPEFDWRIVSTEDVNGWIRLGDEVTYDHRPSVRNTMANEWNVVTNERDPGAQYNVFFVHNLGPFITGSSRPAPPAGRGCARYVRRNPDSNAAQSAGAEDEGPTGATLSRIYPASDRRAQARAGKALNRQFDILIEDSAGGAQAPSMALVLAHEFLHARGLEHDCRSQSYLMHMDAGHLQNTTIPWSHAQQANPVRNHLGKTSVYDRLPVRIN